MFKKLFKKEIKEQKPQTKREERTKPLVLPEADLTALYNASVQKTPKDFVVHQVNLEGNSVNVAFDSACTSSGAQALLDSFRPNFLGQEIIYTHFAQECFIGFQACAILSQNWLINKACSAAVEDAASIEYEVTLTDEDLAETDNEVINKLKDLTTYKSDFDIKSICKKFGIKKRQFGQILCIPVVEGVDYKLPFNIDAVKPNSYKGMRVIEPMWYQAVLDLEGTTNPASKRYYEPTYFRLPNGQLIHYSWCLFGVNGIVDDLLKPTYYWGGYPLTQLIYQRVFAAEKTANEAPMLAMSKRLNYVEGNLNAYIADQDKMNNELKIMSWLRNNWGWLLIKKEQRIGQLDTSLTDYDAVTMLQYQLVAAISGVPSARLLETSPKGWQSTGSYEDNNYKKLQLSIQTADFIPILNIHFKLLAKSIEGKDYDFNCTFKEIDVPTEKERAEINEIKSRTEMNYVQAGVVSPDEVRKGLREDVNSGFNTLTEEMEGESDPFKDIFGGGENSQSPFSLDEWNESEHPRKANGQFGEGGSAGVEKSTKRDKIKSRERKEVQLAKDEYAQVMHELNTNLTEEQRKKKLISKNIGNFKYTIQNEGFNEYRIINKRKI